MKANELKNLPSCVPFILLVCLSTTDHTTQEDKATAGSTCRRETHLMPSYPDPAPRTLPVEGPRREAAESSGQHVEDKVFGQGFRLAFAPEKAR